MTGCLSGVFIWMAVPSCFQCGFDLTFVYCLLMRYFSLEGQILKLMLQYFGHLMRREDSLEKTSMLGKCEGKRRRRGRQRTKWLDSVIEATNMNLTQLRVAVEDRRAWRALVHEVTKSWTRHND